MYLPPIHVVLGVEDSVAGKYLKIHIPENIVVSWQRLCVSPKYASVCALSQS